MLKNIFVLILLGFSNTLFAQEDSDSFSVYDEWFEKAIKANQIKSYDTALIYWNKIINSDIDKRSLSYGSAYFNIGITFVKQEQNEKAKEWFKKLLVSDLKDNTETGDIMEAHANFKHNSAMMLGRLYQTDSNYLEALKWVYNADTLYRYWGFPGSATSISKKKAYLLQWKTDLLLKTNQKEKAIKEILTELICVAPYNSYVARSVEDLKKIVDTTTFKMDFDKALDKMQIVQLNDSVWHVKFDLYKEHYQIPITNAYQDYVNYPIYYSQLTIKENTKPSKTEIIDWIRKLGFYKEL